MFGDDLTVIVPVKGESKRCRDKNFREFADGKSLFALKIEQLREAGIGPESLLIATDARRILNTSPYATLDDSGHNATFAEALDYWISHVRTKEVAIVHVTCPLFDATALRQFFCKWNHTKLGNHDSLFVAQPFQHFLVDQQGRPVNFQFGPWHAASQRLPSHCVMTCSAFVLYRATAAHCHYYIGQRPAQFLDAGWHVDIDTEADFRLAQLLWKETRCPVSRS